MFGFCLICSKNDLLQADEVLNDFQISFIFINPFSHGKIEKHDFGDSNIPATFQHKCLGNRKSINLDIIRNLNKYSLKNFVVKVTFTLTVFRYCS